MKKTVKIITLSAFAVFTAFSLNSCKKIETPTNSGSTGGAKYENGIFISNEGSFGAGNGSISYYNSLAKTVKNSIFSIENSRPLGDVVQSITKVGDKAYICVNGSNKIEVVESNTFKEVNTITTGVSSPRYLVPNGNLGYVSNWGNGGEIAVIDFTLGVVVNSVQVGSGPERMVINNNNLYVANSGGFGVDSTVTVISTISNTPITTIDIGVYNPSAIVNGSGNMIWVLAKGRVIYDGSWNVIGHDPSKLIEINTSTNTVVSTTTLFASMHPANMEISPDKSTLYFGGSYGFPAIYSTATQNPSTPTSLIAESNYGFFVNQSNGNLFILQEASSSNGKLLRYSPSGNKLGEYTVGVFPNGGTSKK